MRRGRRSRWPVGHVAVEGPRILETDLSRVEALVQGEDLALAQAQFGGGPCPFVCPGVGGGVGEWWFHLRWRGGAVVIDGVWLYCDG